MAAGELWSQSRSRGCARARQRVDVASVHRLAAVGAAQVDAADLAARERQILVTTGIEDAVAAAREAAGGPMILVTGGLGMIGALAARHAISDIVHLAGTIPDEDPVRYFRTDTTESAAGYP